MNLHQLNQMDPWEWPDNADKIILKVLLDKKAQTADRILAAVMAESGTAMNDKLATHLLAIAQDNDELDLLRSKAIVALGPALEDCDLMGFDVLDEEDSVITEKKYNEITDTLQKMYMDTKLPQLVRRRILETSARAPKEWHKDAIGKAFNSNDPEWKLSAVFAMVYVRGFEDKILETLKNNKPDTEIFYYAINAAGTSEVKDAWLFIKEILYGPQDDIALLLAAITSTVSVNPTEAKDKLFELYRSEDEEISEAAYEALVAAGFIEGEMDEEDI